MMKSKFDISIGVATNRPRFNQWITHQIFKQANYLTRKGLTYEVIIATEDEYQVAFFENLKLTTEGDEQFKYNWIIVLRTPCVDVGTKRNSICSIARGTFVCFLDDDDWYPEYRLHFQWLQFFHHPSMDVSVVDRFLSYAKKKKSHTNEAIGGYSSKDSFQTFYVGTLSESSLFFRATYGRANKFNGMVGEGNSFFNKETKVIIEPSVELLVAITHDSNICTRVLDEVNGDLLYCSKEGKASECFPFDLTNVEKVLLDQMLEEKRSFSSFPNFEGLFVI